MYEKREHVRFLYYNVIKINNNILRNCRGISNLFYTLILEEKTLWWFNNNIINFVVKMLVGWKFNRDGNLTGNPGILVLSPNWLEQRPLSLLWNEKKFCV